MWFHLRKDPSFRGPGFAGDTYRENANAQLKARDALIDELLKVVPLPKSGM